MSREDIIEAMAKEVERDRCRVFGWTDEQFETWWNRDPYFVAKVNEWGHFRGTKREKCIHEVEVAMSVLNPLLERVAEGLEPFAVSMSMAEQRGISRNSIEDPRLFLKEQHLRQAASLHTELKGLLP